MAPETATATRPARAQLVAAFGADYLSIESLFEFCFLPPDQLEALKALAQPEEWGEKGFVLLKYMAVHVRLAMEEGLYVWDRDQIVQRAGQLVTAAGLPIYLGLAPNPKPDENPWVLSWVGERPSTVEILKPVDLDAWPALDRDSEVVVACDLAFLRSKLGALTSLPLATQLSAITGAVGWSVRQNLAARQFHGANRGYFVPVHLTDRDGAPELVAPVQVQSGRLLVRTLLDPHVAYAPARAVVERREQLPRWLVEVWERATGDAEDAGAAE
jgi:hypothetical protein